MSQADIDNTPSTACDAQTPSTANAVLGRGCPVLDAMEAVQAWLAAHLAARAPLRIDSRQVQAGDAFLAVPGQRSDGRNWIAQAAGQGAAAVLVHVDSLDEIPSQIHDLPEDFSTPMAAVLGLRVRLGAIAAAWFDAPSQGEHGVRVTAITGTNGKTSSAWWLAQSLQLLSTQNPSGEIETGGDTPAAAIIGTLGVGTPDFDSSDPDAALAPLDTTGLTTPDAPSLQLALHRLRARGVRSCAIEASSIGIVEGRLDGTHIDTAIFTNCTQDHLDYHGTMAEYWAAKRRLFEWPGLKRVLINVDDAQGRELAQELKQQNASKTNPLEIWTFAILDPASSAFDPAQYGDFDALPRLFVHHVHSAEQGLAFTISERRDAGRITPELLSCIQTLPREAARAHLVAALENHQVQTQLLGTFNLSNLLGVVAGLRGAGVALGASLRVTQQLRSVPGRMQQIRPVAKDGDAAPLVVVDYAHTPDALAQTLAALAPTARARGGRLWCVFGCGGNRDASKRPLMARAAQDAADCLILTSDNPRDEDPLAILVQMQAGLDAQCAKPVWTEPDRGRAIAQAITQAAAADVVLIAGKGHENYQEINGQRQPFSDQAQALAALNAQASAPFAEADPKVVAFETEDETAADATSAEIEVSSARGFDEETPEIAEEMAAFEEDGDNSQLLAEFAGVEPEPEVEPKAAAFEVEVEPAKGADLAADFAPEVEAQVLAAEEVAEPTPEPATDATSAQTAVFLARGFDEETPETAEETVVFEEDSDNSQPLAEFAGVEPEPEVAPVADCAPAPSFTPVIQDEAQPQDDGSKEGAPAVPHPVALASLVASAAPPSEVSPDVAQLVATVTQPPSSEAAASAVVAALNQGLDAATLTQALLLAASQPQLLWQGVQAPANAGNAATDEHEPAQVLQENIENSQEFNHLQLQEGQTQDAPTNDALDTEPASAASVTRQFATQDNVEESVEEKTTENTQENSAPIAAFSADPSVAIAQLSATAGGLGRGDATSAAPISTPAPALTQSHALPMAAHFVAAPAQHIPGPADADQAPAVANADARAQAMAGYPHTLARAWRWIADDLPEATLREHPSDTHDAQSQQRERAAQESGLWVQPAATAPVRWRRVITDSRQAQAGDLFVALQGERMDGHDFLAQVRDAGASAAVVAAGRSIAGLASIEVGDTTAALGALARGWRNQFTPALIAVTGSNGKTTVTQMLRAILAAYVGEQAMLATQGNYNNAIGVPWTLFGLSEAHRMAVVELGMNHPGEIAPLARMARPAVALVNNAQREHQEFMHTVEAVAEENASVFQYLDDGNGGAGVAVFPADDAFTPLWRERAGANRVVTFGESPHQNNAAKGSVADVFARHYRWEQLAWQVQIATPEGDFDCALHIAGEHNVRNALAATACAWAAGVPLAAIAQGLSDFAPVSGRSRLMALHWPHRAGGEDTGANPEPIITLVDDSYNANPDSVAAAIDVLAALPPPRLLVLGDMAEVGENGLAFHAEAGHLAHARGINTLMTLGEASRATQAAFGPGAWHFEDMDALIAAVRTHLHEHMGAGANFGAQDLGSVLVKGSRSMRMEQVVAALAQDFPGSQAATLGSGSNH